MKKIYLIIVVLVLFLLTACNSTDDSVKPGDKNISQPEEFVDTGYVYFRDNQASYNSRYYAKIVAGDIWIKPNSERTGEVGDWIMLENLPEGLAGDVTEFGMDDEHIIALNSERQIYTMWSANQEISKFRWQVMWGFPFWFGPGMQLRDDILKWDFEVVSISEDGNWIDPAGNYIPIGAGKCSHIIMLNDPGNTITFNDPWLPLDYSYEIGTPNRGTFVSRNLSSSGSYHFIINDFGDMYTRFFDFDISGIDSLFFPASYEDQRGLDNPKLQLPAVDWVKQPKIDTSAPLASITDRISLHKIGKDCIHRIMRVEGTDENGHYGFYEKDVVDLDSSDWVFVRTGRTLQGEELENKDYDSTAETSDDAYLEDRHYDRNIDDLVLGELPGVDQFSDGIWIFNWEWAGELLDFNCYHSPATMRISLAGTEFDLKLHYRGTIRLLARERGLDDNPRTFDGAIEIPAELRSRIELDPDSSDNWIIQKFLDDYLNDAQWNDMKIYGTADDITVSGVAKNARSILWTFGNGQWADLVY